MAPTCLPQLVYQTWPHTLDYDSDVNYFSKLLFLVCIMCISQNLDYETNKFYDLQVTVTDNGKLMQVVPTAPTTSTPVSATYTCRVNILGKSNWPCTCRCAAELDSTTCELCCLVAYSKKNVFKGFLGELSGQLSSVRCLLLMRSIDASTYSVTKCHTDPVSSSE